MKVNVVCTGWDLRTIDMMIEELLHSDVSCSIALPRLPKRIALEDSKLLKGARVSVLDEDWDVSNPPYPTLGLAQTVSPCLTSLCFIISCLMYHGSC